MTEAVGSQNGEEAGITKVAAELCEGLKIGFRPTAIAWMSNLGDPRHLPSDQVVFIDKGLKRGRVVLPSALRGKLETEDWRPLIASSLFYQLTPEFRRVWRILGTILVVSLLAGLLAVPLLTVLFALRYTPSREVEVVVYFSGVFLLVFFLILMHFSFRFFNLHVIGELRLKADRRAAQLLGKDQFLRTLEKINAMRIEDLQERNMENRTIWRGKVWPWPTINERVENLR